ncbi:hypothetical protein ANN_01360 [Periplaneta americana]|uniref:Uncharacterized protein n=1 Tax=Periplaneta americana TaxID=6978 RepID=A0ABQ8TTD1_PERAM|nr:hypothetical protein ANN_01360 [Periplaneta americana]
MSPGSSTESYPEFAHIGLRENPGKNLNQVTCPDRESNPGHLVSRPDVLTVTPQTLITEFEKKFVDIASIDREVQQFTCPLTIISIEAPLELQLELTDLQNNTAIRCSGS